MVGTGDRTALWHGLGATKMPPRPFMGGALMAKDAELKHAFAGIAPAAFSKKP